MPTLSVGAINRWGQPFEAAAGLLPGVVQPGNVRDAGQRPGGRLESLTPPGANGRLSTRAGVTLIELLIVVTIMGVVAGLSFSTAAAGLDSLRLRSVSGQVLSFLEIALDRAERRQQVVELVISPAENALRALSADASFDRTLTVPEPVHIVTVEPPLVNAQGPQEQRRFLLYPGGTLPRIAIDLITKDGRKRQVLVDPITGFAHAEAP